MVFIINRLFLIADCFGNPQSTERISESYQFQQGFQNPIWYNHLQERLFYSNLRSRGSNLRSRLSLQNLSQFFLLNQQQSRGFLNPPNIPVISCCKNLNPAIRFISPAQEEIFLLQLNSYKTVRMTWSHSGPHLHPSTSPKDCTVRVAHLFLEFSSLLWNFLTIVKSVFAASSISAVL